MQIYVYLTIFVLFLLLLSLLAIQMTVWRCDWGQFKSKQPYNCAYQCASFVQTVKWIYNSWNNKQSTNYDQQQQQQWKEEVWFELAGITKSVYDSSCIKIVCLNIQSISLTSFEDQWLLWSFYRDKYNIVDCVIQWINRKGNWTCNTWLSKFNWLIGDFINYHQSTTSCRIFNVSSFHCTERWIFERGYVKHLELQMIFM